MDLITGAQALALLPGLSSAEAAAVPGLVGPASRSLERWCKWPLAYAAHLEYHRPGPTRTIRLKAPFVLPGTVELRADPTPVAELACVDAAATRATATLTATTLTLARYGPSAPGPATIALSSRATLADLVAAVAGLGGWALTVPPGFASWLVADLEPNPGAMAALAQPVGLLAFTRGLSLWAMDRPETGVIELTEDRPQAFRYADRTWAGSGYGYGPGFGFTSDPRQADVRCSYQAGFDPAGAAAPPVPDDLQLAVALTIRAALDAGQFSGTITRADLGNTSVEIGRPMAIPAAALGLLSPYRSRRF